MRPDMDKVIVERPRRKGHAWLKPKGYRRRLARYGEDGPPRREGMKQRWGHGTKWLNEHLGPLRRYLDSQVGRPWDQVFSEICAHINRDSAVQDHVRDHVDDYVTTHVVVIDGVPCDGEGGRMYGTPLHQLPGRGPRWYVCPRTGLLRRVEPARERPAPPKAPLAHVRVSETLQCRFLGEAWHLVTLAPLSTTPGGLALGRAVDVLLGRPVSGMTANEARQRYGAAVYAVAKRRLARRELRDYPIPREWWEGPDGQGRTAGEGRATGRP